MTDVEFEINTYGIHLFSRQPESPKPLLSVITLWNEDKVRGYIHFYPDTVQLPNPSYEREEEYIRLRFHFSSLPIIIDLLRSEKPLFIQYSSHPPTAILRTEKEPIGEEEKLFLPKE